MATNLRDSLNRPGLDSSKGVIVNDCHSGLNPTRVHSIRRPTRLPELCQLVRQARRNGTSVSVCGHRHAMGGQPYGKETTLIDMRSVNRVLRFEPAKGLVEIEAGISWPELQVFLDSTRHLHEETAGPHGWAIHQKQTGADRLTLGGALAANIHGRGLTKAPFVADVESFVLVDSEGHPRRCSRSENRDLFALAAGGYGLFGIVYSLVLRLTPRRKMRREVRIIEAGDLERHFSERIEENFEFGDFQFATDELSDDFLRKGIFACYRPVERGSVSTCDAKRVSEKQWLDLVTLAHSDKSKAFAQYTNRYRRSHGRRYWSDELQYMKYVENYHREIDRRLHSPCRCGEMITEIFVPRNAISEFLKAARDDLRRLGANLIYGTVRLVERDMESFLAWAREPWACVIFNLCVPHDSCGVRQAQIHFRQLIDRGLQFGGSYYLTYHRFARPDQVERAHPRLPEFLRKKRELDPEELFFSDWYQHYRQMFQS